MRAGTRGAELAKTPKKKQKKTAIDWQAVGRERAWNGEKEQGHFLWLILKSLQTPPRKKER